MYNDDFHDNLKNYQDKINHSIKKNGESEGRFHTKWLNMMYPRLRHARNLLKEDGVTFISIDHNEMVNLVKICDEIFSADNRLGIISVVNNMKCRSDSSFFATCNEYLICYAKNKDLCSIKGLELSNDKLDNDYKLKDEISEYKLVGLRKTGSNWKREGRPFMYYPILYKDSKFDTVTDDEYQKIYNKQNGFFDDNYVENLIKKYENLDFMFIQPMNTLIKDKSLLTDEEIRYASNNTYIYFLIYNEISKKPVLAIEVEGYKYHKEGTQQYERDKLKRNILFKYNIPLLRLKTNKSGEESSIKHKLRTINKIRILKGKSGKIKCTVKNY